MLGICVIDVSISLILRFNEDQPLLASFTIDKSHCLIDVENPWFMFLCIYAIVALVVISGGNDYLQPLQY